MFYLYKNMVIKIHELSFIWVHNTWNNLTVRKQTINIKLDRNT